MAGTQVSLRVDADLKERAYETLKSLGVSPSDLFRDVLEFVVVKGRVPVKKQIISDEDAELIALARERLSEPGENISVTIEDLRARVQKKRA